MNLGLKLLIPNKGSNSWGTVIAYGEQDNDESSWYSCVIFLDYGFRIPNVANYMVCEIHNYQTSFSFRIERATVYANIVEAANAYASDYGMDI